MQNYTISESLSIENIHRIQNCMITESAFKFFSANPQYLQKKGDEQGTVVLFGRSVWFFCSTQAVSYEIFIAA